MREDVEEFCQSCFSSALDGDSDKAIREIRSRLASANAHEKERLNLTLAEIYSLLGNRAQLMETIFLVSSSRTKLRFGERESEIARILYSCVEFDIVERRLLFALSIAKDEGIKTRSSFLLALFKLYQGRDEEFENNLNCVFRFSKGLNGAEEALELSLCLERHYKNRAKSRPPRIDILEGLLEKIESLHCRSAREVAKLNMARAIILELSGSLEQAEIAYGRVLSDPVDLFAGDVVVRLSRISSSQGNFERAIRRLEEGLHHPACRYAFQLYNELNHLYERSNRLAALNRTIKMAEADERVSDPAALSLARAFRELERGKIEEAKEAFFGVVKSESTLSVEALEQLADIALEEGETDKAIELFDEMKGKETVGKVKRLEIAKKLEAIPKDELAMEWYRSFFSAIESGTSLLSQNFLEKEDIPRDYLEKNISRFRILQNKLGVILEANENLKFGRLLLSIDKRNARFHLRQAAARGNREEQCIALLLLGKLQMENDPAVAISTLRRASSLMMTFDRQFRGEDLYLLAKCSELCNRPSEMASLLKRAIKSQGLLSKANAHLDLARHWLKRGEPVRALALLRKMSHFKNSECSILLDSFRANALEQAGDTRAAGELYTIASGSKDQKISFHSFVCLAGLQFRNASFKECNLNLDRAMKGPYIWQKRLVRLLKGWYSHKREHYEKALSEYDLAAWPTWSEFGLCLKLRGHSLEALGETSSAARSYLAALLEFSVQDKLGESGEIAGLSPMLLPEYSHMRKMSAKEEIADLRKNLFRLVENLHSIEKSEEEAICPDGIAGLQRLVRMLIDPDGPSMVSIYNKMAELFSSMGQKKESKLCFRKCDLLEKGELLTEEVSSPSPTAEEEKKVSAKDFSIEKLASGASLVELRGLCKSNEYNTSNKDTDEMNARAIENLEKAVESASAKQRSRHLFALANTLFDIRRFDEAAQRYTEALFDPECPQREDVQHNLGITWNELGQYEQAIKLFDSVLESKVGSLKGSCLYHKGNAQLEIGKLEEAVEAYEDVLELEGASLDLRLYSLINLAHCKERLGDPYEAKRCLLEALGKSRQGGWIMLRLAALDANQGNFTGARNWKERAREEFLEKNDIYGLSKLSEILKGI